jgi:hypothetical protein
MIHLDPVILHLLHLRNRIHEHIHRALLIPPLPVQHRHSQTDTPSFLALARKRRQHGLLALPLGLAVEVRRLGLVGDLVGRVARRAGEDVVGGDVEEEDVLCRAEVGEGARGGDVEGACAFGVAIAFVGEAICCACGWEERVVSEEARG